MEIVNNYKKHKNIVKDKLTKGYRNISTLWLLSSLSMVLSASINLINQKALMSVILGYTASVLLLINAYINYKKYKQYKNKYK